EGQARWCQFDGGSELVCIERVLRERRGDEDGVRLGADTVSAAIKEACEALDSEWRCAALAHLGYAKNSPNSRVRREENAAACVRGPDGPISERTYRATLAERRHHGRRYRGRTFDSWSEVTLTLVAEALIGQQGADPVAFAENGEGHLSGAGARRL